KYRLAASNRTSGRVTRVSMPCRWAGVATTGGGSASGIRDIPSIVGLPGSPPACHAHRIRRQTWQPVWRCSVSGTQQSGGSVTGTRERPRMWRFFVHSFIGAFVFFVPIEIAGESAILLGRIGTGSEAAGPAAVARDGLAAIPAGGASPV